jgi:lysophospholipase L1-like esterase
MKPRLTSCLATLALGLLFANSTPLFAQQDVSHYPTNFNSLPGKGPPTLWNGLPKVWAEREAQFAQTASQENGAVVFLGDSITQGWTTLGHDFPDFKTANRGIGGDTTRGVLYRLDNNVLSLKPRAVVLLIGTNDIGNGADPRDVADNINEIVKEMKNRYPKMPIIVCEVMPSSVKKQRPADKIKKLNSLIKKDMRWKRHVYVCDTWSIYADFNGDAPIGLFPDLLHPNGIGYTKWSLALKPIFTKLDLAHAD